MTTADLSFWTLLGTFAIVLVAVMTAILAAKFTRKEN